MNQELINNASFLWSANILKKLMDMGLITQSEYEKISKISADHYNTNIIML